MIGWFNVQEQLRWMAVDLTTDLACRFAKSDCMLALRIMYFQVSIEHFMILLRQWHQTGNILQLFERLKRYVAVIND